MATIQTTGFSGEDRLLKVVVPVDEANREYQVVVSILPIKETTTPPSASDTTDEDDTPRIENGILVTGKGWPKGFFERTAGAFADDPIERGPQGEYEVREPLD